MLFFFFLAAAYQFKIIKPNEKLTITCTVSVMFPVMAVDMGNKSSKGFLKNKFNKEICSKSGLDSYIQYIDTKCNSTFSHIKYLNSHKEQRLGLTLSSGIIHFKASVSLGSG